MRQKPEPDAVNLTPMIDIVFQMIIFFVYTIDLDREKFSENIEIEWATRSPEISEYPNGTIYPQITASGNIMLGNAVSTPGQFRGIVRDVRNRSGQHVPVMIYADAKTKHKHVKRVMDICSEEGLYDLKVVGLVEEGK